MFKPFIFKPLILLLSTMFYSANAVINIQIDTSIYTPQQLTENILANKINPQMIVWYINDEAKYYVASELNEDINTILGSQIAPDKTVNVSVVCFKFGDDVHLRPYILRGKKATPTEIEQLL